MSLPPRPITDESDVIRLAIAILKRHGWVCLPPKDAPGPILTPQEVAKRCDDMRANTLHRRLYSQACPAYYAEYGITGRILRIKLTPDLEEYLRRPLKRHIQQIDATKPRTPSPYKTPPRKSRRQPTH